MRSIIEKLSSKLKIIETRKKNRNFERGIIVNVDSSFSEYSEVVANYLKENGIELLRANVGDRYVLEKMIEHNVAIGGEQSGHIILLQYATTGDGVLTSLKLVEALRDEKKYLDEMIGDIKDWPQKLVNVVVDNNKKNIWNKNKNITDFIAQKEKEMEGLGRVLVRTSGTEPLVRVMVEGKEMNMVEKVVNEIAEVVKKELA